MVEVALEGQKVLISLAVDGGISLCCFLADLEALQSHAVACFIWQGKRVQCKPESRLAADAWLPLHIHVNYFIKVFWKDEGLFFAGEHRVGGNRVVQLGDFFAGREFVIGLISGDLLLYVQNALLQLDVVEQSVDLIFNMIQLIPVQLLQAHLVAVLIEHHHLPQTVVFF